MTLSSERLWAQLGGVGAGSGTSLGYVPWARAPWFPSPGFLSHLTGVTVLSLQAQVRLGELCR